MVIQGINCVRLFKQYKADQNAELQAEREAIAAERAEAQRIMQELCALRSQINNMGESSEKNGIITS